VAVDREHAALVVEVVGLVFLGERLVLSIRERQDRKERPATVIHEDSSGLRTPVG
jgi:hypothetical protein